MEPTGTATSKGALAHLPVLKVSALLSSLTLVVALAPAAAPAAAQDIDDLEFVQPSGELVEGLVDIEVDAPDGTTAVRFFVNEYQLAELTDLYATQTQTEPVWNTATDADWLPQGRVTLRAEADTPSGTVEVSRDVTVVPARPSKPGVDQELLSGGWSFAAEADLPDGALDGDEPAATQHGFTTDEFTPVIVPNSLGAISQDWDTWDGMRGVYRHEIDLRPDDLDQRLALHFESCYWECHVYVNGEHVGLMTGGYLPERFDITHAARPGPNTLAVVVDSRQSSMGAFQRSHQFYWNWAGLQQEVYLQRTADVALVDFTAEGARDGTLTLRPSAVNATGEDRQINTIIHVDGPNSRVLDEQPRLTVAADGQVEPFELEVPDPALWSPDNPQLYRVTLRAADRNVRPVTLTERTGFRDVVVDGDRVFVNDEQLVGLQGFNRHLDYPGLGRTQPAGLAERELKKLVDKGFTIYRPAHYPTTPAELDIADELGLLVIEEINVTGLTGEELQTEEVRQFAEEQLSTMIERDRSHPSIIGWAVGNENWTDQVGGPEYIRDIIQFGKVIDDTRFYTQPTHRGTVDQSYGYQDVLSLNRYGAWYDPAVQSTINAMEIIKNQVLEEPKPFLLSEYGAEAIARRPGTARGTEYYQSFVIDEHNRLLAGRPDLVGKMHWTSTEFLVRPDWLGGDHDDPIPPFHAKALETWHRDHEKLAYRVMFSPIRVAEVTADGEPVTEIEVPVGEETAVSTQVVIDEVRGEGAEGEVVVSAPDGFAAEPVEFAVDPGGQTTVEVVLEGVLGEPGQEPDQIQPVDVFVHAVVDEETEAHPYHFTVQPSPGPVIVESIDTDLPLFGGQENDVSITLLNELEEPVDASVTVEVPDGWTAGEQVVALEPGTMTVPVTVEPAFAPSLAVLAPVVEVGGRTLSTEAELDAVATPRGGDVTLALDAGSSSVTDTYAPLRPEELWDPDRGYGWVGQPPDFRNRGGIDALRSDFVLSRDETMLRLSVPPGLHDVYVLRGDRQFSSGDTVISEGGEILVQPRGTLRAGEFEWLRFQLDGGSDGRTADLTISGRADNFWRINALVMFEATGETGSATIEARDVEIGTTPRLVGYNQGHFLPGSNTAAWIERSEVSAFRMWASADYYEPSELPLSGDNIHGLDDFEQAKARVRADPENPEHINWNEYGDRIDNFVQPGVNRTVLGPALSELADLDVDVVAMMQRQGWEDADAWGERWEYWLFYYAMSYHLGRHYGVEHYQVLNEPDHPSWEMSQDTYVEWLRFASDAIRSALNDVNERYGAGLEAQLSAPELTHASATEGNYNLEANPDDPRAAERGWGQVALETLRTNYRGEAIEHDLFDYFATHRYDRDADAFIAEVDMLAERMPLYTPTGEPLPLLYSETNRYRTSIFNNLPADLDTPGIFTELGTTWLRAAKRDVMGGLLAFKFSNTSTAALGRYKTGFHHVWESGAHDIGGSRKGAEVMRLFARAAAGERPIMETTVNGERANLDALLTAGDEHHHLLVVNRDAFADVDLVLDLAALDVEEGTVATVEEVSAVTHGAVAARASVDADGRASLRQPAQSVWLVTIPRGRAVERELSVAEAATVRGGDARDDQVGRTDDLRVQRDPEAMNETSVACLKFDVSGELGDERRAVLSLADVTGDQNAAFHVYGLTGASWSESDLTWRSAPNLAEDDAALTGVGETAFPVGRVTVAGSGAGAGLDVTEFLQNRVSADADEVSFVLVRERRFEGDRDAPDTAAFVLVDGVTLQLTH